MQRHERRRFNERMNVFTRLTNGFVTWRRFFQTPADHQKLNLQLQDGATVVTTGNVLEVFELRGLI